MADNLTTQSATPATIPASSVIATDDAGAGGHVQIVKLAVSTDGSATALQANNTDGLLVNLGTNNDVTVTGSVTANAGTNLNTSALLTESDFDTKTGALTENAPATDTASSGLNGRLQRIAQRITSLITALGSPFQAGGSIGNTTFASTQSGTWNVTNVSGTVSLPTGASTLAEQQTQTTALQLIDDIVYTDDTSTHSTGSSKGALFMAAATPTDTSVNANDIGAVAMTTDRKLHVSVQDSLPAGTAAIGKLAANSGVDIGDVDITSVTPGTAAASLGKAEDAAHSSGDTGVMVLGVRNDAGTALAADGDYIPLSIDSSGAVRVTGGGGGTQYTEDVAAAADPVGSVPILVRKDTPAGIVTTDGDNVAQRGTNYGAAYVQVVSSSGAFIDSFGGSGGTAMTDDGAFTVGTTTFTPAGGTYKSTRDSVDDNDGGAFAMNAKRALYVSPESPNGDSIIDDTNDAMKVVNATAANLNATVVGTGTFAVQAALTAGTNTNEIVGDVAQDAAVGGNPVLVGGRASTAAPTDMSADGDSVYLWTTLKGALNVADAGGSLTVDNGGTFATQAAQSGTWNITNVSGTVSLPTGASTLAEQQSQTTSLQLIDDTVIADDAAFTPATTKVIMAGFTFDDVAPDSVNEGDAGAARMSANRNVYTTIRDAAGNERGLNVDASGQIAVTLASAQTLATVTTVSTVTAVTTLTGGAVAHDGADSGNPVKIGAKASSTLSDDTMVANADRTDLTSDLDGAIYVREVPLNDIITEAVSNTDGNSTAFTNFGATASTRSYITSVTVFRTDSGTSMAYIDFRDGTAGSVIYRVPLPPSGGATLNNGGSPLFFTTANTALAFDVSSALTTVYISLTGFKSKVKA